MTRKDSTPDALLIVADEMGDLWRIFPDGSCWPIRSEDDLDEVDNILALPHGSKHKPAGDRWRRIRYERCAECDGEREVPELGDDGEPELEFDYDVDEDTGMTVRRGYPKFVACEECRAQGWTLDWTDEFVRAADAAKVAA